MTEKLEGYKHLKIDVVYIFINISYLYEEETRRLKKMCVSP